ncbi:MAG: cell division protein FtsA [Bacillota bacterium]|nr:cell division protein FtsA [Bacillota bacterium]
MSEYIVGIDIGSSKVCAAVGKKSKSGELQIIGLTSVKCKGLKKGVVVDIDHTAESIKNCINQLETMVDMDIKEAYISLPGGIAELVRNKGVIAISSEDREIRQSDIDRANEAAKLIAVSSDKEIVGIEPEQYIIDGYDNIKDPLGMSGVRLEVDAQVIIAQTTVVTNLWKSVSKAGVEVKGIELQPKAASQVALMQEEKELGCALVDVGAETIDLCVFKNNNICFTDMIPYGGNSITSDIALCLKIPFNEAEKLKIKYGDLRINKNDSKREVEISFNNEVTKIDVDFLNEIIEARVEELLKIIGEKLYASGYYKEIRSLVLIGGGISLFRGITELSKDILSKPARVGSPSYVGAASPLYACSVGIVKDVADSIKFDSNFNLNEDEGSRTKSRSRKIEKEKNEETGFLSKVKDFLTDFF